MAPQHSHSVPMVILEWAFSPPDCLEEPCSFSAAGFAFDIRSGAVEARTPQDEFCEPYSIRAADEAVRSAFSHVQLVVDAPIEVTGPTRHDLLPDGRRVFTVSVIESANAADWMDVQILKDGVVVEDSRAERIKQKRLLATSATASAPRDPLLDKLLTSYAKAKKDSTNQLVHLYEVLEALQTQFDGRRKAAAALAVSETVLKQLGTLCNAPSDPRGRHRGNHHGPFRALTDADYKDAQDAASTLIQAYISIAEKQRS